MVENQECQNLLRENTRLGPFFELDESFLCAGGQKGVDTCKGDGGSPLVCEEEPGGVFVQVGFSDKIKSKFENVLQSKGWDCILGYWVWRSWHPSNIHSCGQGRLLD